MVHSPLPGPELQGSVLATGRVTPPGHPFRPTARASITGYIRVSRTSCRSAMNCGENVAGQDGQVHYKQSHRGKLYEAGQHPFVIGGGKVSHVGG